MTFRDILIPLLLALTVALLAAPVALTDRVFLPRHTATRDLPWSAIDGDRGAREPVNHALSDKVNLIYPDVAYTEFEESHGRLPLWNPYILCGVPHLANPMTGVCYPLNLLLMKLDPLQALLLTAALHLALAGIFFYAWMRAARLCPLAAALGACAYMFSGWVAAHLQNTMLVAVMAWLPLGLFAIEMRFRGSGRWSLMLLALAVAMMWLAGFPQLSLLACILLGVYALTGILWNARRVGLGASGHRAGLLLLFAVVGLLLASVQILPTVELMRHAGHQDRGSEDLLGERFRWPGYVGLLFPETLGDPMQAAGDWRADHGTWVALAEAAPDGTVGPPGVMNWGERTLYPGVLVLVLSLFGLFRRFGRRTASIAVVAFAGLSMASMPIVIRALAGLPGLGVGAPARAVALLAVAIPALAAFGFDAILDGAWRIGRRRGRTVTISALVLAVLVIAMLTSLWFREDAWIETGVGVLQDLGVAEKFGVEPREPAAWVEEFRPAFGRLRGDLLRLALVLGAAGALCLLDYRRGGRPVLLSAGIPLLVLADLLSFLVPVNLPVSRDGLFEATPSLTWLREHAGDGRFLRVASDAQSAASDADRLYPPNLGMLERLHDVQGYRELVPRRYLDYWRGLSARVIDVGFAGIPADRADSPLLDLARVRYLVAAGPIATLEQRRVWPVEDSAAAGLWIYENPDPLPRAYLVHRARALPDAEALELLVEGALDPRQEVVVDHWPAGTRSVQAAPAGGESVQVVDSVPGELRLSVHAGSPGFLVMTDAWYPGWTATVTPAGGGPREAEIVRAMTIFRAVPIEAGTQEVVVRYEPRSVWAGGILTGLGWIGFFLLPLLGTGKRDRGPPEDEAGGPDRLEGPIPRPPGSGSAA